MTQFRPDDHAREAPPPPSSLRESAARHSSLSLRLRGVAQAEECGIHLDYTAAAAAAALTADADSDGRRAAALEAEAETECVPDRPGRVSLVVDCTELDAASVYTYESARYISVLYRQSPRATLLRAEAADRSPSPSPTPSTPPSASPPTPPPAPPRVPLAAPPPPPPPCAATVRAADTVVIPLAALLSPAPPPASELGRVAATADDERDDADGDSASPPTAATAWPLIAEAYPRRRAAAAPVVDSYVLSWFASSRHSHDSRLDSSNVRPNSHVGSCVRVKDIPPRV